MRVACFIPTFPAYSQNFILNQVTGLIDRGCEIDIFARSCGDVVNLHPDVARYKLLERTRYWAPSASRMRRAWRCLREVAREEWRQPMPLLRTLNPRFGRSALGTSLLYVAAPELRRDDYDVYHCHFGNEAVVPVLLRDCLRTRAKLVTSFYGHDVSRYPMRRGRDCYTRLFARGDHFVALSQSMKTQLIDLGCPAHRIAVQHLGVRCGEIEFRPRILKPGERVRLVCTARLVEKKGLEYAIRAIAKLRDREIDVELQIVGDGPLRSRLTSLIDEFEVRDRVTLHGSTSPPEAIRIVEHGHIFVLPSVTARDGDEEGTPVSILEAMATGIPVVSTLHSGIPEQIEDGVSGFLVPERDAEAIADRLAQLIRQPENWPAMGRAARKQVEINFDAGKQCTRLLDLYRSLS